MCCLDGIEAAGSVSALGRVVRFSQYGVMVIFLIYGQKVLQGSTLHSLGQGQAPGSPEMRLRRVGLLQVAWPQVGFQRDFSLLLVHPKSTQPVYYAQVVP